MEGFGRSGVEFLEERSGARFCRWVCMWFEWNFCVGDLVKVMWRMRTNDGRRENGCSVGVGLS